ncbi:MAG: hypothetical protein IJ689_06050 [Alphaproteobacteria bacterium]|nr:hypothetical protein [Alphaproteobacteria bacterium]
MKKNIALALVMMFFPVAVQAGDWNFENSLSAKTLYGYTDTDAKADSHHHLPSRLNAAFMAQYRFNDEYEAGAYVDLSYGIDQYLKDYNHGSWGEEVYGVFDSPYGKLVLGQSRNAAYQLGVSAPNVDMLNVNQSDVVNFISSPNLRRNRKGTAYRVLNSTDINTDGTALKASYISPEFGEGTMFGISYIPESYSRDGLISNHASYKNKAGYVAALYQSAEITGISLSGSLGAAYFDDADREVSLGLSAYRKGWTLGAGVRRTWVNHYDDALNKAYSGSIDGYDAWRDAFAYNAGIGYEFGPFKTALTYFYSKADGKKFEDKIIQFSNSYQFNKMFTIYAAAAHGDFTGKTESNKGYALITGLGVKF